METFKKTRAPSRQKSTPHLLVCPGWIPRQRGRQPFQQYGELKTENLHRLYFQEEGFSHIEREIHVAEFIKINRELPHRMVTQGVKINFKYTGQLVMCYRCNSTEHIEIAINSVAQDPQLPNALKLPEGKPSLDPPIPSMANEENTTDEMDHDTQETNMEPKKVAASELRASLRPDPRSFTSPCFAWPFWHLRSIKKTAPVVTGEIRQS